MTTLVSTLDIHVSDRRSRTKKASFRASFPELKAFNEVSIQLAVGESYEIKVESYLHAYLRDVTTVELTNNVSNEVLVMENIQGIIVLPLKDYTVKFSVDPLSTIELERVIHLVYG